MVLCLKCKVQFTLSSCPRLHGVAKWYSKRFLAVSYLFVTLTTMARADDLTMLQVLKRIGKTKDERYPDLKAERERRDAEERCVLSMLCRTDVGLQLAGCGHLWSRVCMCVCVRARVKWGLHST